MRTRKKTYTEWELGNNPYIINTDEIPSHKGKWGKGKPVHIEIGTGKGNFIRGMAKRHPEIQYIAMERQSKVLVMGAKAMREEAEAGDLADFSNIVFSHGDAEQLLEFFEKGELDRIYLNFSDPWPNRKKWHKKRLTHRGFLDRYKEVLTEKGELHFKTDNQELFDFSLEELKDMGWELKNVTRDLHLTPFHTSGENIMTEYEKKFSSNGDVIYRLEAVRPM